MNTADPDPSCVACHGCGTQDEMDEIEGVVHPCPWCWQDDEEEDEHG